MKKRLLALALILTLIIGNVSAYASCNVVTIMYHNITNDSNRWDDYCIPPIQLESDIEYFLNHGYVTLTASELTEERANRLEGKKVLLLTFDDGYAGWYTYVLPILRKYNVKATMYVVGAKMNHYGYLADYQIKELANSGLVEIGNHTDKIHQAPLELVKKLYDDNYAFWDIVDDIKTNGAKIQAVTGKPVTSISWPYGYCTDALDSTVKREGYKISFSTNYGVNVYNGDASEPFNRINREHSTTSADLLARAESKF